MINSGDAMIVAQRAHKKQRKLATAVPHQRYRKASKLDMVFAQRGLLGNEKVVQAQGETQ